MIRKDYRSYIISTTIENTDESQNTGNQKFDTTDYIWVDSLKGQFDKKKRDIERRIPASDHVVNNNATISKKYKTRTSQPSTTVYLRSASSELRVFFLDCSGNIFDTAPYNRNIGICPSLHLKFLSNTLEENELGSLKEQENTDEGEFLRQYDIREVKDKKGKTIYHTLHIGEYFGTNVDINYSKILEKLYNDRNINKEFFCTGRWYSNNGQRQDKKDYAGKHCPEYEYKGKRYIREVIYSENQKEGTIKWENVEPISYIIRNWEQMPKNINPKGDGSARYFDLKAENAVITNLPFYPESQEQNSTMWQNSTHRGFLNGIDVRNIKSNGNPEYGANRGGNFTGKCNFLNEAFNLSREPMIEYAIPDSEIEIPDDAFNGCITLKKLIIHTGVRYIGKRAFDGLNFKYAYKTKTEELVLSEELPKNKADYEEVIELDKIKNALVGFDYGILLQINKMQDIITLVESLNKNCLKVPYVFGLELVQNKKVDLFCNNTIYSFFRNEVQNINDMLLDYPEKERLAFFKFANSLGCFSTKKILDKKGKETSVIFAQKASSLLARFLKTEEMKLRNLS